MKTPLDYESPPQKDRVTHRRRVNYLICAAGIAGVHLLGTGGLFAYVISNFDRVGDDFDSFGRVYEFPMNMDAITWFFVLPNARSGFGVTVVYATINAIIWGVVLAGILALIDRVNHRLHSAHQHRN